jgi:hypothetical protein
MLLILESMTQVHVITNVLKHLHFFIFQSIYNSILTDFKIIFTFFKNSKETDVSASIF